MNKQELNLFSEFEPVVTPSSANQEIARYIPGLTYISNFITQDEEHDLLCLLDAGNWSGELARRVQHFGYKYDYDSRRINEDMRVGALPAWLKRLGAMLVNAGIFRSSPDQVIANEYLPGQGISMHIDCQPCFGDTVASLSLGSPCIMDLTNAATDEAKKLLLEPQSIVVIKADARYLWKHGIAKRKRDTFMGNAYLRSRRVSLTFRNVIL